jgi:hypothetical protein
MSGVLDDNGIQWEHCNICSKWVDIDYLMYEEPTTDHPYGLDLCHECSLEREDKANRVIRAGQPTKVYFQIPLPKE